MVPYRIYLSGCGIAAAAHIGALQELQKHTPITAIREFMGVSAGAFVAMCLTIGYTLDELQDFCLRFDFTNITEMDSIPGWLVHFGMDTGDRLYKMIAACLHVKGLSSDITFKDVYEQFGYSLRVLATDLHDAKPMVYAPDTTPAYCVVDAVRASMSVPYYFQPFVCPVTGHFLVDGAVTSNNPLFILSKEEQLRTISILIRVSIEPKEVIELEDLGHPGQFGQVRRAVFGRGGTSGGDELPRLDVPQQQGASTTASGADHDSVGDHQG